MCDLFSGEFDSSKSAIYTSKFKKLFRISEDIKWGCDYLRLSTYKNLKLLECPCFSLVPNDTNNSSIIIPGEEISSSVVNTKTGEIKEGAKYDLCPFGDITVKKTELYNSNTKKTRLLFDISCSYNDTSTTLFQIKFNGASLNPERKAIVSQIDIYGKAWRLERISNFDMWCLLVGILTWRIPEDKQQEIISSFLEYYISRYDFRIDFFSKDKNFYKTIVSDSDTACSPNKLFKKIRKGDEENIYSPELKRYTYLTAGNRNDKYVFLRCYDKKKDVLDNHTEYLYSDYFIYEGLIYRYEFEFGSRFTTANGEIPFFPYNDFGKIIDKQIFEYLGLSPKSLMFSKKYIPEDIPFDMLPLRKQKREFTRFQNIGVRVAKNGINPFELLQSLLIASGKFDVSGIYNMLDDFMNNRVGLKDSKTKTNLRKLGFDIDGKNIDKK